jgi:hypothetical protein
MENLMNASVSSVYITSGAVGLATVQGVCARNHALG